LLSRITVDIVCEILPYNSYLPTIKSNEINIEIIIQGENNGYEQKA